MTTAKRSKKTSEKPSLMEEEVRGEYIVEKIIDKRVKNGVVQYFLKWADYDESHNSWEPACNVLGLELLPEFEREWNEKQKNKESCGGGRQRRKSMKEVMVTPEVGASTSTAASLMTNGQCNGSTGEDGRDKKKIVHEGSGRMMEQVGRVS